VANAAFLGPMPESDVVWAPRGVDAMVKHRTLSALPTGVGFAAILHLAMPASQVAQAGETNRVSISTAGVQANDYGTAPSISADGRFVAFTTDADNLVLGDTNGETDVFLHDRMTGETTRVSVSSLGEQADACSGAASLSSDGRFVVFHSEATNLVPNDTNRSCDVFVHDRYWAETVRVSIAHDGAQGAMWSSFATISADGRYVAFYSPANNMVPDDTNQTGDVFVRDLETATIRRVSVASDGEQGNGLSADAQISADGRYIAFNSVAANLVADDDNGQEDIFVHDRVTRQTERVSQAWNGLQSNGQSLEPSISADGRYVAYCSYANNLFPGDTNGRPDVFVFDRQTRDTIHVSVSSTGAKGNDASVSPSISPDGYFVAFASAADNLVPEDSLGWIDIFVHGLHTGQTVRVSTSTCTVEAESDSSDPSLSDQGYFVAFTSLAENLVPDDTNQRADIFVHEREPACLCSIADPPGSGSVARFPDELCLPVGSNIQLTAHAEGICEFSGWSGVPAGEELSNPVIVPLEASKVVTAHFSGTWGDPEDDCNANGIPDSCDGTDCNDSGLLDICDVWMGTSPDCNENLHPDECDIITPGDFNVDGFVDLDDFAALPECIAGPGQRPFPPVPECIIPCLSAFDFDLDGDVDLPDISEFWSAYRDPPR